MQLSNKVVAITGGGRGLGRAMALAFAAEGARVAALDVNGADLAETCAQCTALGVRAVPYQTDVVDESQVDVTRAMECRAECQSDGRFPVRPRSRGTHDPAMPGRPTTRPPRRVLPR